MHGDIVTYFVCDVCLFDQIIDQRHVVTQCTVNSVFVSRVGQTGWVPNRWFPLRKVECVNPIDEIAPEQLLVLCAGKVGMQGCI